MAPNGELDLIFQALADPTRRDVVQRLAVGPHTTTELASAYDMSLPSFTQHLGVLERAGLVSSSKEGRSRTFRLRAAQLRQLDGWLAAQRRVWESRLDQLDHFLQSQEDTP